MEGWVPKGTPLAAELEGWIEIVSWVAPEGAAVIEMAAEVAPVSPAELKDRVRLPADPVIERLVNAATPAASVLIEVMPPRVPPPLAIAAVTVTPLWETGLPEASCSCSTGCWANTVPLTAELDGWVVIESWVAGEGGAAVIEMAAEVAPVSPAELKDRVRLPADPVMERLVNEATPEALVVAEAVPPRVPPPLAIAAVTVTPLWETGLPEASRSCSTGCWANTVPLTAELDGWVVIVSWVAGPGGAAPTTMVAEVTGLRPGPLN